mgnify:CR=1 FL=1
MMKPISLVTIKEVALFLQAKESTLYSWAEKGSIPSYKINGLLRFDMEEIGVWLKESRKTNCGPDKVLRKRYPRQNIDAVVKKAIESVKGKGYNPSIGKPGPNQGPQKGGLDEGIV